MKPKAATPRRSRIGIPEVLQGMMLLGAVVYLAMYLYVAVCRIGYPYGLEWMEGGTVDQVARLLAGRLMYVQPSIDFVPAIYTPLYYYVSAAASLITGIGFLPLRLVSFAASLGIFVLLYLFAKRETGNWSFGLVAAGLFAASYRMCGAWFDLARVDSLFVFLVLLSAYRLRFAEDSKDLLLTAIGLWLAFLTKQSGLLIAVPLLLYSAWTFGKRSLVLILPFAALTALSIWILDLIHNNWFTYYVFDIPGRHRIDSTQYLGFWTQSILSNVPILVVLSLAAIGVLWRHRIGKPALFAAMFLVGCLSSSWSSMLHSGGYSNVLMPSSAALALASVLVFKGTVGISVAGKGKASRQWYVVVAILIILQFAWLRYDPVRQIPSMEAKKAGADIVEALRSAQGEVYMPYHVYLPVMAGKRSFAHQMALKDVARADSVMTRKLAGELTDLFNSRRFGLVVLDNPWTVAALEQNYVLSSVTPPTVQAYQQMTGMPTCPKYWYVPRPVQ